MSVEDVEKFYSERLQNNQQLVERLKGVESNESFYQQTAQLGQEDGYTFTSEDVKAFLSQKQSERAGMSDQDLEAIAGGKGIKWDSKDRCPRGGR